MEIKLSILLLVTLVAWPLASQAKSSKVCDAFISSVKEQKMNYKQAFALSEKVKFRKADEGYDCEKVIQSDAALMRQMKLKLPSKVDERSFKTKVSSKAKSWIKEVDMTRAKNNKRIARAAKRQTKSNQVMSNELECNGPVVMGIEGELSMSNYVLLSGACFGDQRGRISLSTPGHSWRRPEIIAWSENAIAFVMPDPSARTKQPKRIAPSTITIQSGLGQLLLPVQYVPLRELVVRSAALILEKAYFFGLSVDCPLGSFCELGNDHSLSWVGQPVQIKLINQELEVLRCTGCGVGEPNLHWQQPPSIAANGQRMEGSIHVGCAGACFVGVRATALLEVVAGYNR